MSNNSFYEFLGVDRDFTPEDLKAAFDEKMIEVRLNAEYENSPERLKNAYETLSNRLDRKIYDMYGERGIHDRLPFKK